MEVAVYAILLGVTFMCCMYWQAKTLDDTKKLEEEGKQTIFDTEVGTVKFLAKGLALSGIMITFAFLMFSAMCEKSNSLK